MSEKGAYPWLFSARTDLSVFLGSALLSFALLAIGGQLGILHSDSPQWIWVPAVLLIDVAHVWSTVFRVYWDRDELRRRPWLYWGMPAFLYVLGVLLYSLGPMWFWTCAAYFAVYHFVRQQYGWVALYRRRGNEFDAIDRWIDTLTIYGVTLYPLLYWHAHLPRQYWWFVPEDFVLQLPPLVDALCFPLYLVLIGVYLTRALQRWLLLQRRNPGKDIVVATTALCWYVGIVYYNSDYAFTVTNVVIHGVPYFALVYFFAKKRARAGHGGLLRIVLAGPFAFVGVLVLLAYGEEFLWDRLVWHQRQWLFGQGSSVGHLLIAFVVPLLALPQLTHYALDGFIWRRRSNPDYKNLHGSGRNESS